MKNLYQRKINYSGLVVVMLLGVTACGGGGSSSPSTPASSSVTYSTTSNKGDYSEWTLVGSSLNATWNVENDTGGIDYTYNIVATCSAEAADGTRSCAIDAAASSCSAGLVTCLDSPSGSFDLMDAPGVALFVHTSGTSYGSDQLHVGFEIGRASCRERV